MTKTIRTQPNQSLLDMILTEYGTLEAGMQVAAANNIDLSNLPMPGSLCDMPEVAGGKVLAGRHFTKRVERRGGRTCAVAPAKRAH